MEVAGSLNLGSLNLRDDMICKTSPKADVRQGADEAAACANVLHDGLKHLRGQLRQPAVQWSKCATSIAPK